MQEGGIYLIWINHKTPVNNSSAKMSQNKKGPSYQLLGSPTVPEPTTEPTMFQPYGQQVYFMAGTGINGQPTVSQPVMFIPTPQVQVDEESYLILFSYNVI